ncbi:AraC family transcriptional regulator [Salipiger mangrovisoli]|uniref:Helix-turn-helix transcriptional regulator n=1 Tax=Salipiger mangrovisoli TaxID=2865933 RepID=A0ABR9X0T3_9RHOB|nr:AraC family transcriptional regulator [Salipiger mangrovisoli]MBE9637157.1 helix-turn-helix transcriptional regulator [Salipiger mangrovisoli]
MTFMPRMTSQTQAIHTTRPLRWRRWEGAIADVWHVHGAAGGGGFYRSPDPRLVIFLDAPRSLRLRTTPEGPWMEGIGAFYIPAGMPLWSALLEDRDYAHLDFHLEQDALAQRLRGAGGQRRMDEAHFLSGAERTGMIAGLLAEEVQTPSRPDVMLDGLLSALLCEVLDLGATDAEPRRGGLPPHIIRELRSHALSALHRRIEVAELAKLAGLSESWLTRAFKQSLGTTPQRWLTQLRVETAMGLMTDTRLGLAEIAAEVGFADQAHLTRSFRTAQGETPGAWRKARTRAIATNHGGLVQSHNQIPR